MLRLRSAREWLGECVAEGPPLLVPGIESEKVQAVVAGEQISFWLEDILDKSEEKKKIKKPLIIEGQALKNLNKTPRS